MKAFIADNWSGTCGAVYVAGDAFFWEASDQDATKTGSVLWVALQRHKAESPRGHGGVVK